MTSNEQRAATGPTSQPPIDYMSNGRATFATCMLCGCGLRGFSDARNTRYNAIVHLYANHEGWDKA